MHGAGEPCGVAWASLQSPGLDWGSREAAGGRQGTRRRQLGLDSAALEVNSASWQAEAVAAGTADECHDLRC